MQAYAMKCKLKADEFAEFANEAIASHGSMKRVLTTATKLAGEQATKLTPTQLGTAEFHLAASESAVDGMKEALAEIEKWMKSLYEELTNYETTDDQAVIDAAQKRIKTIHEEVDWTLERGAKVNKRLQQHLDAAKTALPLI